MKTSKGTIQGYNGVVTVDKKHQVIVDAQVFGEGQEYHTLILILKTLKRRFKRVGINADIPRLCRRILTAPLRGVGCQQEPHRYRGNCPLCYYPGITITPHVCGWSPGQLILHGINTEADY